MTLPLNSQLPASIRINVNTPFPALVTGAGPVGITKTNGIWTVTLTVDQLPDMIVGSDITTKYVLVFDHVNDTFIKAPLSQAASRMPTYTVATVPPATFPGMLAYISDESGGAVVAFTDGTNWRRVTDRAIIT